MARLSYILMQLILIVTLLCDVESKTKDYAVTVIAYPVNGPFRSGQLVPLQCTITPTPPFPVVYIWRSPTQNHSPTARFPSSAPITTVTINDNHPLYGHYYCHVLSANNRITLAVGHVTINPTGILQPIGATDKPFTPPAPLQLEVELQPKDSELLDILSDITYKWQHNYTVLSDEVVKNRHKNSGFTIKNNSLAIARTNPEDAGVYSVKIGSFGVMNVTRENCANTAFQVLRNYAIFNEVGFIAYNSEVSNSAEDISVLGPEPSSLSNVMKEVSFISGEPLRINTRIPIAPAHRNIIRRNPNTALRQRVFYNGELIQNKSSKDVRVPSEVFTPVPQRDETAIVVTLVLPRPTPEDEGVYEMQLFVDLSRLSSQTCLDYIDFVRTSDGLNLPNVLIGSVTLQVRQQGPPQVMVETTEQVLTLTDGTEQLPLLTCSVTEDDRLSVKQLRWVKDGKILAEVQDSGTLVFDTATNPITLSPFGLYTCEATLTSQNKVENSTLIAERASFMMELEPVNGITCLDLSKETMQLMLDMLLEELQFSFSYETNADFTIENFAHSSITCSSEGSRILMSTDVIYSNSDGSITASALEEMAGEWMNGIRTANGATFQISRPGTTQSLRLDTGQLITTVLSTFLFGVIVVGIIILVTCCIAIKRRKRSKKQKLAQMHKHNSLALQRESIINNSTATMNQVFQQSESSAQVLSTRMLHYDRLAEDSRSVPLLLDTMGGPPDIIPSGPAFSKDNQLTYGAPNIHSRGTHLPNVQRTNEDEEVVYSSLSVTENYAYNRRQDLSALGHPRLKNQPSQNMNNGCTFFNKRQRSVHHYDYPTVSKEDLCAGDTDSMGYQSVNDMIKD